MANSTATVDEILALIKEIRIDMKDFNANMEQSMEQFRVGMEELRASQKETVEQLKKTAEHQKKMGQQLQETAEQFKRYFPYFRDRRAYGAVAYLKSDVEAAWFTERQGMFVIRATGDSASIVNAESFKPKEFPSDGVAC